MSIPKRQEIREAAKALLLGHTSAGDSVYSNRVSALWKSDLPSISIFLTDETSSPKNLSGKQYVRTGTLVFQILAEASENLDDTLDNLADEVESLINDNQSISGTVSTCLLQNTEIELSSETSPPLGTLTLVYQIQYIK